MKSLYNNLKLRDHTTAALDERFSLPLPLPLPVPVLVSVSRCVSVFRFGQYQCLKHFDMTSAGSTRLDHDAGLGCTLRRRHRASYVRHMRELLTLASWRVPADGCALGLDGPSSLSRPA